MEVEAAPAGLLDGLVEDVALAGERGRTRLEAGLPVAHRVGAEAARPSLEEAHPPAWVVRKDVAGLVVDGRERDTAGAAPVLDVVQDGLDALVGEIEREGEDRRLHGLRA